ncbi:hypothetical protein Moror_12896 [Moniliophthora roreri MCA 2997]|uniref:Uncharacterized protein n=1 Tax=Moniliophthora roreri (strain MCA 2997) TaxID=1381753 RepID=V2XJU3_MONRO|nr:hypothetical protein Moror_12896 [Moniliophthora roreri MCA 2997]
MPAERTTRENLRQTTLWNKPEVSSSTTSTSKSKSKKDSIERLDTDVILCIKPEFVKLISTREKNYEYRKYKLRSSLERLWLYETAPTSAITYVMSTTEPKTPGQVRDPTGVGNDDFDAGKKVSKYGYPVTGLWRLRSPVTSKQLKETYGIAVPQGFCYLPKKLGDGEKLEDMEKVF